MKRQEKRRRATGLLVVHACAVVGLSVCSAWAQSELNVSWGEASGGFRVGISASAVKPGETPTFEVFLENAGTDDFVLNLGRMLANGKVMFPDAVRVALTRPDGSTCELQYFDRRYPGVAGRMDDFIVALRAGSRYTVRLPGDRLWCGETMTVLTALAPGRHHVVARFQGRGATARQLDMQGVALLNFWTGAVESTSAQFEVRTQ
jgi:hypothetical protein